MNKMMKCFSKVMILLILGVMINHNHLKAEEIAPPAQFQAVALFSEWIPESFFKFHWMYADDDLKLIDGFKIYRAPNNTEDIDDFTLFEDLSLDDERLRIKNGPVFSAMIQTFDSAMGYSFYITAYGSSDESSRSNFSFARLNNQKKDFVKITNQFPKSILINQETVFTPQVETNFQNPEYEFELIAKSNSDELPENINLDEQTGEITWTPEEGGTYHFGLKVTVTNADELHGIAFFTVFVSECEENSTITLLVTNENNEPVKTGRAALMFASDDPEKRGELYVTTIDDGEAEFTDVAKGNYTLGINAYGYEQYWYDGKSYFSDADIIEVDCAENITLNIELTEKHNYYVRITNTFQSTIKLDEEYTYTPEVETNFPDAEFEFELISLRNSGFPEELEFNEETGEIIWTPQETGYFEFKLIVKVTNADKLANHYPIGVNVTNCDELAEMIVNISADDDAAIPAGSFAMLISFDEFDNRGKYNSFYQAMVEDGKAVFENIDQGTYYLAVLSNGFYEYWYEDASNFWSATPIDIECGEQITLDVNLQKVQKPNFYNISGTVKDAETNNPIPFAHINLISDRNRMNNKMMSVMSNKDGEYIFRNVPDDMSYIVSATKSNLFKLEENDTIFANVYLPQYYDGVSDFSEATVLSLDGDLTGIDFNMTPVPDYENSISGTVVGDEDEIINDGYVVAYLVQTSDEFRSYIYYSVSSLIEDGEFNLHKLIPGDYVLLAFDAERNFLPAYYAENEVGVRKWQNATRISIDENSNVEDIVIILPNRENMWGDGRVKGRIAKGRDGGIIMGQEDEPLNGAMISISDNNGNVLIATESDNNGNFSLENINYGTYNLLADKVGYNPFETTITINESEADIDWNIILEEDVLLSVGDNSASIDAYVFPNPATDLITVSFEALDNYSVLSIRDVLGNDVVTRDINTTLGLNSYEMKLDRLSSGVYFIRIQSGGKQITVPFIIE